MENETKKQPARQQNTSRYIATVTGCRGSLAAAPTAGGAQCPARARAFAGLILFAAIFAGFYHPLQAQVGTASLTGIVTDPSGAAIPDAAVSLESMTRSTTRQAKTDSAGSYVFTSLLPDTYRLVVGAKGFSTKTTQNIEMSSGQGSTLNVTLELATSATEVTVGAEAPCSRLQQLLWAPKWGPNS